MSKLKLTVNGVYTTVAEITGGAAVKIEFNPEPTLSEYVYLAMNGLGFVSHPCLAYCERRELEQKLLRAAGNHSCEYVWSDVLKAHVRIGEPSCQS